VRICVVGSINIDMTFRTSRFPESGETIAGKSFQVGFGGKGANQAVMAARLGANVALVSRVGTDWFGGQVLDHLIAAQVDTTNVERVEGQATGAAGIVVDDQAQNRIMIVGGANATLTPADVLRARQAIESADALLCQLEVPIPAICEALRLAREAGVRTILNPAPAQHLDDQLLALVDLCIPNESELALLTDMPVRTKEEAIAAGLVLLKRGPATLILTMGERGVLLVEAAGYRHFPAFTVEAVDTTGAGDVFIASLAVFLGEGLSLTDAIPRASAAGAICVTLPGAQSSFPSRAEIDRFLGRPY
jgi:ribokinase